MPKRIKRSRRKGWRKPEDAVIVDRTSRWGNPFRVVKEDDDWWVKDEDGNYWGSGPYVEYDKAAEKACSIYRGWVTGKIGIGELDISQLEGKDLVCFCDLDKPCHADVLLELANSDEDIV